MIYDINTYTVKYIYWVCPNFNLRDFSVKVIKFSCLPYKVIKTKTLCILVNSSHTALHFCNYNIILRREVIYTMLHYMYIMILRREVITLYYIII